MSARQSSTWIAQRLHPRLALDSRAYHPKDLAEQETGRLKLSMLRFTGPLRTAEKSLFRLLLILSPEDYFLPKTN